MIVTRFKIHILLIFFTLLSINRIFAEIYYLEDLINHGLKNSSSIISSQNTIYNTRDNHSNYILDLLPSANYSTSYTNPSSFDSYYSSGLSISKSVSLNEPMYFNLKRSNLEKKIVEYSHENLRKKIALDILYNYIDIVQTEKNIIITEENLKLQRRIFQQVKIQYDNDRKTIYDVQQSQIDTLNTYIQLIDLNNSLSKQRENLFFIIKLDDYGYPIQQYDFNIENDDTHVDSQTNSLSIKGSELRLEKSKFSLTQQYLNLYPRLSLSYSWSTSLSNKNFDELFKFNSYKDSGTLSLNLSYPLFNHFEQGLNYRIAKRNFSTEELNLIYLKDETNQQISQAQRDYERLLKTYELFQQKHSLSKVSLDIAEERFRLGVISNLDLDKARLQYLDAEYQLVNRFYSLIRKQEELKYIKSEKILGIW